jgi:alpha-tubulin suppressor-like RCC1 family protein
MIAALCGVVLGVGCAAPDRAGGSGSDEGETTQVTAQLTAVPSGTQCVKITVTPPSGSASVQSFTLTAGASTSNMSLGALPAGSDTFTGAAYAATCSTIGSSAPTYVADPVVAIVRAGTLTSVTLTFRPNNSASVTGNFIPNVVGVAAGGYNSFALTGGAPLQWGYTAFTDVPVTVAGAATPATTAIAAGAYHACALHADGTVWCWGISYYGGMGPGVPMGGGSSTPVQVPLSGAFTMIAAGLYHTCAYRPGPPNSAPQEAVFCWGYNADGELGNGTNTNSATPVQVSGITGLSFNGLGIRALSAGAYHTVATMGDGHFFAWGANNYGQLGDNTTSSRNTAEWVTTDVNQVAISAGYSHTCALHADGSVWCWGGNFEGQIGDGTFTNRMLPTAVVGLAAPVKQLTAGGYHNCALLTNGQTVCWGYNADGEIGDLTTTLRPTPVAISFGGEVAQGLAAGYQHTCALTTALNVWCWGYNGFGEIGDGTNSDDFGPTKVLLQ